MAVVVGRIMYHHSCIFCLPTEDNARIPKGGAFMEVSV